MNTERGKELRFLEDPGLQFALTVSRAVTEAVRPVYGIKQSGVPVGTISKDFQYAVDEVAEDRVKALTQEAWRKGQNFAYVTEDQGLVLPPGNPELILLVDPVDGSRPAMVGAEMACVSIAGIRGDKLNPVFADIDFGVIHAIKENRVFVVLKGAGVWEVFGEKAVSVRARQVSNNLADASVVCSTYAMSNELMGIVIDPLLKEIAFKMDYPSGSYGALTIVRGQNEIHMDIGKRLRDEFPDLPIAIRPNAKSSAPLDVAPSWLALKELEAKVTDGYGKPLDDFPLWKFNSDGSWSSDNEISWVAAASPTLHNQTMQLLEKGIQALRSRFR